MEYELKLNDSVIKSGTLDECWKSLINAYGEWTVKALVDVNIRIEAKK